MMVVVGGVGLGGLSFIWEQENPVSDESGTALVPLEIENDVNYHTSRTSRHGQNFGIGAHTEC